MSYVKQTWDDLPSQESPFSAERMNHIEDGIDSKLDKMVVSKSLSTAGWYRVAKYNGNGKGAASFLLNINTWKSSNDNISCTTCVNVTNSKVKLTTINTLLNSTLVNKIRATLENDTIYIEIYYDSSSSNAVGIDIVNQKIWERYDLSILDFEAPTDTATVLDELPIGEMTVTNSNGTAIKFPDGTMICTLNKKVTDLAITSAYGSLYIGTWTWIFPVAFVETPTVTCGQMRYGSSASWGTAMKPSITECSLRAYDITTRASGTTTDIQAIAIGRWK